jgi:hypothetical protein
VLRKRVAVLVAAAVMVLSMLVVSAPAFAQGEGGSDPQPGQTEKARAPQQSPPPGEPGVTRRAQAGSDHDTSDRATGFGERVGECA